MYIYIYIFNIYWFKALEVVHRFITTALPAVSYGQQMTTLVR